jgi:hypothetical protein
MLIFTFFLFVIKSIVKITTYVGYVILVYCLCSVHTSPVMKHFAQLFYAVLLF